MKKNIGRTPNITTYLNYLIIKISKVIHISTRIKTVPVYLVSIVSSKDSEQRTVPIQIEKENITKKSPYHHYLPQYVIMVDIQNIFINIQQIKWYRFPLFLSCVQKIVDRKGALSGIMLLDT